MHRVLSRGYATLAIDRTRRGASTKPSPGRRALTAQALVPQNIVAVAKATGLGGRRFGQVALTGHSTDPAALCRGLSPDDGHERDALARLAAKVVGERETAPGLLSSDPPVLGRLAAQLQPAFVDHA